VAWYLGSSILGDRPASTPARHHRFGERPARLVVGGQRCAAPRGSEYGVQYVFDGLPLLANRSPNFATSPDIDQVQSMVVRTGSYPAASHLFLCFDLSYLRALHNDQGCQDLGGRPLYAQKASPSVAVFVL